MIESVGNGCCWDWIVIGKKRDRHGITDAY